MCQPMIFFSKKQEVSPYLHFQSVSSFHQLRESLMETDKRKRQYNRNELEFAGWGSEIFTISGEF
jgi:hypothetical protein